MMYQKVETILKSHSMVTTGEGSATSYWWSAVTMHISDTISKILPLAYRKWLAENFLA